MAHTIRFLETESFPPAHQAACRCGWRTPLQRTKQRAEDLAFEHEKEMERFRNLSGRPPTLRATRDYYRQMTEDPSQSEADRALWTRLADEIDHRLNESADPMEGQGTLPF